MIADMEGVAGICRWDQVVAGRPGYEEGRILYTEELNAAAIIVRHANPASKVLVAVPMAARVEISSAESAISSGRGTGPTEAKPPDR